MLKKEKISFFGTQKKGHSGYSVILTHLDSDRCILAYKGINNALSASDYRFTSCKWVYMSSLMGQSLKTAQNIASLCRKKNIPFTFNPSSYLAQKGIVGLKPMLAGCELLVLNEEESQMLVGKKLSPTTALRTLIKHARHVVITRGAKGALATDGESIYDVHAKKDPVVETTGAGDAFASACTAGLILGKSFDQCLRMGYAQSTSVIAHIGAKQGLLGLNSLIRRAKAQRVRITTTTL